MAGGLTAKILSVKFIFGLFNSAGLPPHESEDEPLLEGKSPSLRSSGDGKRSTSQSRRGKRRVPISFDDYHALWKGIATSVTSYKQQDECKYMYLPFEVENFIDLAVTVFIGIIIITQDLI